MHQEEIPHLIPLPAKPYDVAPVIYRTVNVEGLITYGQNGYSVPWRYIGSMVPVRLTEREVIVYGPQLEEIARHAPLPSKATGQRVVSKEHRPGEDARRRQAELEERFAELGEPGRQFLDGLLRAQRYGKDQAQRVLALLGTYTRSDLIAALQRAVRYGAYSHAAVERILGVQARPRRSWRRWPRKSGGTSRPGWGRTRCPLGRRRTTNTSANRSRTTMRTRMPRPTPTPPTATDLRRQLLEDFRALGIPLRPEQLDAVSVRAESGGMSHLEFLRAVINEQATAAASGAQPNGSARPGSRRAGRWPTSTGSSMPR